MTGTASNLHGLNLGGAPATPAATQQTQQQQQVPPIQQQQEPVQQQDPVQQQENHQQPPPNDQQLQPGERAQYLARIEQMEAELVAARLQAQERPSGAPVFNMFAPQSTLDALVAKESPRKAIAPIKPGFKADALAGVLPPKIEKAIEAYHYVPYSALTRSARLKAHKGDEAVIITAGGLTAKGIDRTGERNITTLEWTDAARLHVARIRHYHGDSHADALAAHHENVLALASRQGAESESWPIALAYDIHQREAAANDPSHDLAPLDTAALQLVSNQILVARITAFSASSTSSSQWSKRSSQPPSAQSTSPQKRVRTSPSSCFRCGSGGHLPKDCTATKTRTGKDVAKLGSDPQHPNALTTNEGKRYCFRWSRDSSCPFGAGCLHHHACSICYGTSHGAQACDA